MYKCEWRVFWDQTNKWIKYCWGARFNPSTWVCEGWLKMWGNLTRNTTYCIPSWYTYKNTYVDWKIYNWKCTKLENIDIWWNSDDIKYYHCKWVKPNDLGVIFWKSKYIEWWKYDTWQYTKNTNSNYVCSWKCDIWYIKNWNSCTEIICNSQNLGKKNKENKVCAVTVKDTYINTPCPSWKTNGMIWYNKELFDPDWVINTWYEKCSGGILWMERFKILPTYGAGWPSYYPWKPKEWIKIQKYIKNNSYYWKTSY